MILTVTMNASLDKTYRVARLAPGTVMRVREVSDTAGGKGLNVARIAALLGEPVRATGFLGGFNGGRVRALLAGSGVEDAFAESGAETRACINAMDDATGESTEFLEPGAPVAQKRYGEFLDRYVALVAGSDAVTISGSLPQGAEEGFYARLVALARKAGKPVVLDTSGALLREGVAARPTLVKPNRDEVRDLLPGADPADAAGLAAAIRRLMDGGLPWVAVSLGAEGCLFGCREGVFRGRVPKVRAVNPVGCGDAMVAAFAVGLARRIPPLETLRLALAVSAASAKCPRTGGFRREDLAKLLPLVQVEDAGRNARNTFQTHPCLTGFTELPGCNLLNHVNPAKDNEEPTPCEHREAQMEMVVDEMEKPNAGKAESATDMATILEVVVSVNLADIRAEVPRTLYGTCLEDVNHEIYGGLDAQRLYDESFEETQPFAPLPHDIDGASGMVCGRQWTEIATGGGESALDDTTAHWGRRSQRLSPGAGTAGVANGGLNGWGIPCRAGKRMAGHFFVRGRVDSLEVKLQSRDGGATYASATIALPDAGGGRWDKVDFSLIPDTTDPAARFLIAASGTGTVWIDDAYLADEPTNEFGRMGCREDIVAALQREGVTFLRWGGSMVNAPDYLLRNMNGERRPYDGYWFKTSSAGFGPREFVRMADLMGLPCAVSIHAYDATEDAVAFAEWLAQFKDSVCVQIGNEECIGYTPAGGQPTIPDTRRYCEQVRRLVPAMRAANPRLAFASAMMWQPDRLDLMEEAFRLTDGFVDYWDLHVGAYGPDAGKGTRETIDGFREMARRLNPETTMKAAIFEENARIHDMRRALAHVSNLAAAREAGPFLLTSCPANALQPWGQNDNGWDQGQIFFTPDKVWLQPCAWAQRMASENHRDLLVAGQADDADIQVSATRDREGKSIVLHLMNPAGAPRRLAFDFGASAPMSLFKATSLSAPGLEAHNTPDDPERVAPRDVTASFGDNPVLAPFSYTVVEFRPTPEKPEQEIVSSKKNAEKV